MSRLDPKNHRPNKEFTVMLKRKLRQPLWSQQRLRCTCGKSMNSFCDHVMTCTKHFKTTMYNTIRNGLWKLLKKTCMLVKLTSSEAMLELEREPPEVIPELPRLRPFDTSILFDHMLDEDVWRSNLKMLLSVWGQLIFFFLFSFFMPGLACYQKVWMRAFYCPKMSL